MGAVAAHWGLAVAFVLGAASGALGIFVWWARQLAKPAVVQKILRDVYAQAHPHWLQASKEDPTKICPTCGWSEGRGAAARADQAAEAAEVAAKSETRPG